MSQDALIQFVTAGAPGGESYCFTSFPRLFLDVAASLSGFLPGNYSTFIASQSEPDVADRDKTWIQLDASELPTGRFFRYIGGWYMRHPRRQDGEDWQDERIWWAGSEADIKLFDGGNTDPVSTTTGPMWEIDHDYDARFPLAAGTSPKPTTFNAGDTGGEEENILLAANLPAHTHGLSFLKQVDADHSNDFAGGDAAYIGGDQPGLETDSFGSGSSTTINNMPPYRVGYWIKPTVRIYLRP